MRVSLIYATNCDEDSALADSIRKEIEAVVRVETHDLSEVLEKAQQSIWSRIELFLVPIIILSEASMRDARLRDALIRGNPNLSDPEPEIRSYYICRGTSLPVLLERFPELWQLADETMIVEEAGKKEVINDLLDYARTSRPVDLWVTTAGTLRRGLISVILILKPLVLIMYPVGFLAGVILFVLTNLNSVRSAWGYLAAMSIFAAGNLPNSVVSLQIWPHLGPRWRPSSFQGTRDENGSWFSRSELARAVTSYRCARVAAVALVCFGAALTIGQALLLLVRDTGPPISLILIAALLGLAARPVIAWAQADYGIFVSSKVGLLEKTLHREDERAKKARATSGTDGLEVLDPGEIEPFDDDERQQLERWSRIATFECNHISYRRLLRGKDHVFISYPWADEAAAQAAAHVSEQLDKLFISNFLDRRRITSGFVGWRSIVSSELKKATHILIVVSPNINNGRIVIREIRTAMLRWYTELEPSIICVVEPVVARDLRKDKSVPLELRFLLTWCPRVTPQETLDDRILNTIIRQRRRNGRLQDFAVLCLGAAAELRMIEKGPQESPWHAADDAERRVT